MNYAEVRLIGRALRLLLGATLVASLIRGNPGLISQPTGVLVNFLVVLVFYVAFTFLLGQKVLARINPWLGAAFMDLPLLLLFFPQVPILLKFGILMFFGLSLIVAGLVKYGGCEVTVIGSLILRKRYNLACVIFSPLDWIEYKLSEKIASRGCD